MDTPFEQVVKLAEQLDTEQQNLLIYRLRTKQMRERALQPKIKSPGFETQNNPTREQLIRDAEILRQTPVNPDHRLLGKYANPQLPEMSEEEFHAQMHSIATEWEQELDEFFNDES